MAESGVVDWLFLDLNSYFASVEQNERPELRGMPVAVAPVMTDSTCAIAGRIKQGLRERLGPYSRCSIGLASNRYLAKTATNLQKPDGLVSLTRDNLPARLLGLKLTDLHSIGRGMERRLHAAGIADVAALRALTPKQTRRVWGNIGGERFWHALHGFELPDIETARRSIGHSHVLASQFRPRHLARLIARRLAMKAAARMRRLDYTSARLVLGVHFEKGPRWAGEMRTMRSQDTLVLLDAVERLWSRMEQEIAHPRVLKAGITLLDLLPLAQTPADLFADPASPGHSPGQNLSQNLGHNWRRRGQLSLAIDAINRRYGRDTIWFGVNPDLKAPFTGTRIAFTRIPNMAEFHE